MNLDNIYNFLRDISDRGNMPAVIKASNLSTLFCLFRIGFQQGDILLGYLEV